MCNLFRLRWVAVLCGLLLVPLCLSAGKKKAPERFGDLSFVVLRASDGQPVKYASVVIHFLRKDGSEESDGLQLKTDGEGRALIDGHPPMAICGYRWWRTGCRPMATTSR